MTALRAHHPLAAPWSTCRPEIVVQVVRALQHPRDVASATVALRPVDAMRVMLRHPVAVVCRQARAAFEARAPVRIVAAILERWDVEPDVTMLPPAARGGLVSVVQWLRGARHPLQTAARPYRHI